MRKEGLRYKILSGIYNYLMFFLLVAFLVSFSMLFLDTAMFAQFGADTSAEVKRLMIILTGAGISVVVVTMAINMIVQTTGEIKRIRQKYQSQGEDSMTRLRKLDAAATIKAIVVALVALAYPMYNKVLERERERIAPEILRLADELMK